MGCPVPQLQWAPGDFELSGSSLGWRQLPERDIEADWLHSQRASAAAALTCLWQGAPVGVK